MTDLEKFIDLYKSVGIELAAKTEVITNDFPKKTNGEYPVGTKIQVLSLYEGLDKVYGYSAFYTDIVFDMDGKFLCQEIWE